jgi:hypothetical protein
MNTIASPQTPFVFLGTPQDISGRVNKMPRDASILRAEIKPDGKLQYRGVIRLSGSGFYYWVTLSGPPEGTIRFTSWKKPQPVNRQQPGHDLKTVTAKVGLSKDRTHLEGLSARIEVWPRLAAGKQVLEAILSPALREGSNER